MNRWPLIRTALRNAGRFRMNRALIGYTLQETLAPIRSAEALAFADATNDDNPRYQGSRAPVSPFFISRLVMPGLWKLLCLRNLGLNFIRMVHGQQEVIWHGPIRAGDAPTLELTIRDIRKTPAGELLEIYGRAFRDGNLTVESIIGLMVRGPKAGKKSGPPETPDSPERFRASLHLSADQALRYAEASGDHNFIHTRPLLARLAGLPRTIMHGAGVMAIAGAALTRQVLDGDISRLVRMKGRFSRPAFPGRTYDLVGYASDRENEIPHQVLDSAGRPVFRSGLLTFR